MKTIWVCLACGKTSEDRYRGKDLSTGWDESCFINSVKVKKDHLVLKKGIVVEIKVGEIKKMKLFKWQKKILSEIQSCTHKQLLEETLELGRGDCNDGEFSNRGQWKYNELEKELRNRLKEWLNEV